MVDFGEFIGYDVNLDTKIKTPTSWGKIHYAKDGTHIVPKKPHDLPNLRKQKAVNDLVLTDVESCTLNTGEHSIELLNALDINQQP